MSAAKYSCPACGAWIMGDAMHVERFEFEHETTHALEALRERTDYLRDQLAQREIEAQTRGLKVLWMGGRMPEKFRLRQAYPGFDLYFPDQPDSRGRWIVVGGKRP